MPNLVLIRHAKSDYPPGVADHDRPLSARGRLDAATAANWLDHSAFDTEATAVLVSSARRAQDTWAILSTGLTMTPDRPHQVSVRPDLYEAGVGTLLTMVAQAITQSELNTLILVGHNPTIHAAALHLAGASATGSVIADRFPTCAIAVLQITDPAAGGVLVDVVVPRARDVR